MICGPTRAYSSTSCVRYTVYVPALPDAIEAHHRRRQRRRRLGVAILYYNIVIATATTDDGRARFIRGLCFVLSSLLLLLLCGGHRNDHLWAAILYCLFIIIITRVHQARAMIAEPCVRRTIYAHSARWHEFYYYYRLNSYFTIHYRHHRYLI